MARKTKREKRLLQVADELLEQIERSAGELHVQYVSQTRKEKQLFFEDEESRKATREVVQETEELLRQETVIDRQGLRQLVSSLKELQQIQILAGGDPEKAGALRIRLEGEVNKLAQ